ncbi:carbohydrate ABC transporter permease [Neobacillus mesonae]|uniref:Carbohydrate ABC transporter permease n=1 Tax=Neobacillus mesonae TaxID=1193713 RepID=A0A3Q9QQ28_9BACI|nr:carbohydrate ABC transporter permease [Neobacillus mesonae]AZU60433.1 carbohydrate ABC transporter permease [Neobacillus mesonae]MED4206735.1 carbohydrate ABC transporter permease [Neobacillus mesonae]
MKTKNRVYKTFIYVLLIFFSLLFLAPLFWMVTTSLKGPDELYQFPPKWIPSVFHFENFKNAWISQPFTQFLTNSVTVTILATLGQVISSSLVAYGFARFTFKGRDFLFIVLLATMMIPWEVTMIPLYMEFNWLGWINTLKPLIVPAWFGGPFFIFLLRQFIMGIPKELDEAARIDGANAFQIFYKIYLPLMKPPLILVSVFSFLNCWNDYLGPLVFLNDQSKYTLTLGLAQFKGMFGVNMEGIMAITFLVCLPPLVLFFVAQRYIMEDVSKSGVKG